MLTQFSSQLRQEADLIARFAETYHRKFGTLIEQLNGSPAKPADVQCLRMCIEAVDMILESQKRLARAVRDMTSQ